METNRGLSCITAKIIKEYYSGITLSGLFSTL